jgi:hypothetical protein
VVVELLDRPDQAHVALLDQVEEGHATADVLLRDRDHQPEIGLGQLVLGDLVAGLDRLGQRHLLLGFEQGDPADLLEVHPDRVIERDRVHHLDGGDQVIVDLHDFLEVLLPVGDLDPHVAEDIEDPE